MPKATRAQLHERFASWLEATTERDRARRDPRLPPRAGALLRSELGQPGADELGAQAAVKLLAAGAGAAGRADLPAAVRLLERGVDLLPADDPRRLEVLPELAYAHTRRGELERAQEILRSAIEEARRVGNEGVEAYARLDLLRIRTRVDPESKVEDELSEALEIAAALEPTDDLANLSRAYREIGMARFMLGRAGEGEADLEQSAALAHRAGDSVLERAALVARLRPVAWGPTPADAGIAICDLLLSDEVANVANKALAFHVRSLLLAMRGDFAAAGASAADARALIEEFGLTLGGGIYSMDVGFALVLAGDLEQAEHELRRGHDLLAGVGDTGARCTVDAMLADVLQRQGRLDEAALFAEESRSIAAPDDLDAQPRWRAALARVLASRGSHDAALQHALDAVALVEPVDLLPLKAVVYDSVGAVHAAAGRIDEAVAAVEYALTLHERKGNTVSAGRSGSVLDDLRAARPS